jgi:hypothetical protein
VSTSKFQPTIVSKKPKTGIATPGRKGLKPRVTQAACELPPGKPQKVVSNNAQDFTFCPPSNAPQPPPKFNLQESLKKPLAYTPHTGPLPPFGVTYK